MSLKYEPSSEPQVRKGSIPHLGGARSPSPRPQGPLLLGESEFFIDNLLVRIHFIIVMIRWTGLAPWEFEFP